MAQRSHELNLYSEADVTDDDKKFRINVDQTDVTYTAEQSMKFDCAVKYKDGTSFTDLKTKFDAVDAAVSTLDSDVSTDVAALQAADAAEQNARSAADITLQANIDAEIQARVAGVSAVAADLATQVAAQEADDAARVQDIADEESARIAAVAAEAARAQAAEAALSAQITNILSGSPENLDTLAELVTSFQAGDTTLANQAAGMLTRISAIESALNEAFDLGL